MMTEYSEVLKITDAAVNKIVELIGKAGKPNMAVRVKIENTLRGGGYQTEFMFMDENDIAEDDITQDAGPFRLVFDTTSAAILEEAAIDFDEEKYRGGFRIKYAEDAYDRLPATKEWDSPVATEVQKIIDRHINPGIASHNGWVELLEVKDGTAFIEMGGGCKGCAMSYMTLKNGIEHAIIENVPEIKKVLDTTQHAEGTNPYYAPDSMGKSPF
jgi:Fe/S biogenesis protein NfuA